MTLHPPSRANQRTEQEAFWSSTFGSEYITRNDFTHESLDASYEEKFGVTRTAMNRDFLATAPRNAQVLEVGFNIGIQLEALTRLGFHALAGIDIHHGAVAAAR